MQPDSLKPDFGMANRFLKALTDNKDKFVTFQMFCEGKNRKQNRYAKHEHLEVTRTNFEKLSERQKESYGIFVMINKGDGKGRKAKNVVKVRALFIDLDGSPWEPAAKMLKPHIIVETSPERYHLYWKVSDCSLDEFKPIQQDIAKKFNGDLSCVDLPRVLRVPGFFHLKTDKPFMTYLMKSNDFSPYTTKEVIDGLRLDILLEPDTSMPPLSKEALRAPTGHSKPLKEYIDASTGEVINLIEWIALNPDFNILSAINPQFFRGSVNNGKQHIQCPFEHEHTEQRKDLATFAANASPPEFKAFDIHCMHNHCAGRDRVEFLAAMLEKEWISVEHLQSLVSAVKIKRPPYVNYCAQEIAAELQTNPLQPEEFRISLHLMHNEWLTEDGTLPDDDWKIVRMLGITPDEWSSCRDTLIKTGWLIAEGGRLYNKIAKREYYKAQKALMNKIEGGRNGGLKSQRARSTIPSRIASRCP